MPTCEEEIYILGNFVYILLGSPETVKGTSVALPVVFCLFYLFLVYYQLLLSMALYLFICLKFSSSWYVFKPRLALALIVRVNNGELQVSYHKRQG